MCVCVGVEIHDIACTVTQCLQCGTCSSHGLISQGIMALRCKVLDASSSVCSMSHVFEWCVCVSRTCVCVSRTCVCVCVY